MNGGNYRSPKMQVPDTMDIAMDQPENLLFTWNSGFYNRHYALDEQVLGTKGTIIREEDQVRYVPEGEAAGAKPAEPARVVMAPPDIVGGGDDTDLHMRNFIECVRSRKEPNCPFEVGFRSAVAARMAITSFREGRKVRWDPQREEIV